MSELRVWLLGGFRVEWAGQPVTAFESDKARALVCYLLLEARPIRREQLAGLFWGEQPETRARGNLSRVLSNLRDLFPACLASDRETIALVPPMPPWIDAHILIAAYRAAQHAPDSPAVQTALGAALELYRGSLLAGFSLAGCPEFEEWLRIQQEHWHMLALNAWELQTAYHRQRGEWPAAVAGARRVLELEPWRESAHRQVMLLLALQGERDGALRQYEACRRFLQTELGVAPAPETEALYRRIVAADVNTPDGMHFPGAAVTATVRFPLVGRAADHAWLLAQWEAARRGAGGLTLVSGDAGIGKTRLLQEVLRLVAGQGARVLSGRCYEFNRVLPFQAIHEALRPTLAQATSTAASLVRLFESANVAPMERTALFAAAAAHMERLRDRQRAALVLFLDDLQWADADTLDLLHYLVRHFGGTPCWFVGTCRSAEVLLDHPLTRLMQTFNRDGLLHTLALDPLSVADVACLTSRLLDDSVDTPLAGYLFRESEGNPFALIELVEMLREQGVLRVTDAGWELVGAIPDTIALPTRIQDVILQRVQRLSESDQYLLMLAAAFGRPFDAAMLAQAGECALEVVIATLAEWQSRQLARPVGDLWELAHDKIRGALYQIVPTPLRRLLHARLAAALERLHPEEVALLAHHFDLAQQRAPAAHYMRLAGDQARQTYAQEQARGYYQRGLELTDQPELRYTLLSGLEAVCDLASRREEQRAALTELAALVENGPPALCTPPQQVDVALRQAHHAEATSDYAAAAAAAERAVALAEAAGDDLLAADAYRRWGYALRRQERLSAAHVLYEKARALAQRSGAQTVLADCLQGLANVAWNQGDYATAQTHLEQSLALCRDLSDRRGEADAYNILGIVYQQQRDFLSARDHYTRALELRCAIGDRRAQGLSYNNLGSIAYELGDYPAAATAYTTAAALCREAGDLWGEAIAALGLSWVALDQGQADIAQHHALEGLAGLRQVGASRRVAQAEYTLGLIAQARGDLEAAQARLTQAVVQWRALDRAPHLTAGLSALAWLHAARGEPAPARVALEEALALLALAPLPDGVVRPLRAHLHCYAALRVLEDPRASAVLSRARALLHAQAARLPDAYAALFLTEIQEHRALALGL